MLDMKTQYEVVQAIHQERIRELEQIRLARQVRKSQPSAQKIHAVILSGLGRGLMALGEQMQSRAEADERQQTPTHAAS
jgi:hypothetical protein